MDEDKSEGAGSTGRKTPDLETASDHADALKEQVSSPKKKRAHDEVDEDQDEGSVSPALSGRQSPQDSNGASAISRTDRLEPEKKRARDESDTEPNMSTGLRKFSGSNSSESGADSDQKDGTKTSLSAAEKKETKLLVPTSDKDKAAAKPTPAPATSSAFAKSGFAKLSGAASPFGALGAAAKSSGFGGALSSSPSPFGALGAGAAPTNTVPKLSFGPVAVAKTGAPAASPFGALNGSPSMGFGGAFGSAFGGIGASKLTSFAKPGGALKDAKPARPFGAPESGNEESSGGEDDGDDEDEADAAPEEPESEKEKEKEKEKEADESKQPAMADDKKKTKLQKVVVEDGEARETTVFMARAKVYQLDKPANVWKEKGAGILKINVPEATVDVDIHGAAIPESFDASMLEAHDDEDVEAGKSAAAKTPKVVRLIMRQDHTHRVVVNTAVLGATDFVKRETLKAVTFLFTAIEGPEAKPATLQIKMSPPNAELFYKTIELIQKELKSLG